VESQGLSDVRDARMAELCVPARSSPSSFLPPGPFRATWEGWISVDLGTDCTFLAVGTGHLEVTVNGKPALRSEGPDFSKAQGTPVFLKKGRNRLLARYESPGADEDAFVRLFWSSSDFPLESVGPLVTSHDASAAPLRIRRREREGRELFAARRCGKCHAVEPRGMPELEMDAPSLKDVGARLRGEWMARWIQDPRALRPTATMPNVLHGGLQDAADIASYLSTLGAPEGSWTEPSPEAVTAGGVLYAELRCIGCHTRPGADPAPDRQSMRFVRAKWKPAGLRDFLLEPEKHYAWIRMPNFKLTPDEATKLSAFLLSQSRELPAWERPAGDPERGKKRLAEAGCLACHEAPIPNLSRAPALAQLPPEGWSRGCLAEDPPRAPRHALAPAEREALQAFASTDLASLGRDAAPEFAERQIHALRCAACHKRDDRQDLWSEVKGETENLKPPKKEENAEFAEPPPAEHVIPTLSWTGEKLKPEWTAAFLRGEIAERPRPYLQLLRMPFFKSRAEGIVRGLVLEHGCPAKSPSEPAPDPALAEIGRKLSGPNGGLDCIACHGIGPKGATKVFEAPAPNFKYSRARIRSDYFRRWVLAPLRVEPGTKMPQFFENGQTKLTEILDGDANRQIGALWEFLLEGEQIRPPSP
jgi:mono/diheme cytochrome c family protein